MITGVDDLTCAGCGEPLQVNAASAEARRYLGENGLLVADIACRCGALNCHPMPGKLDVLRHRGCRVYELDWDALPRTWAAARTAGVPVLSIAGIDLGGGHSDSVALFVQGQPDPSQERAEAGSLIAEWAAGLDLDAVQLPIHPSLSP